VPDAECQVRIRELVRVSIEALGISSTSAITGTAVWESFRPRGIARAAARIRIDLFPARMVSM